MFGNTSFSFGSTSNTFGNNNNNNNMFGNNNSSAFGSSGFGNSSNTAFGNSGFGNNNTSSFGNSSGFGSSAFGNSSSFGNSSNAFGSTSFGSSSTFGKNNSSTAFGGFGNSSNNTSSFGSSTIFGNNNSSAFGNSGFGNSNNSSFGKTSFGSNTSSFGNSAFGSNNNNNNNTSAFGGGISAFGSNNTSAFGGFGNNSMNNNNNGTGNPKYQPQMKKDGNSYQNVTFNSISAMPAYRNFSFEELRVKDYMMGKKGPSMGMSNSMFGSSTNSFGNINNQRNIFGNNSNTFGSGGFGSSLNNNNNNNNGFGNSAFGNNNNQNSTGFGNSAFGNNNNNNNSFGFGNNNNNTFGSSSFGNKGFGMNNNNNSGSVFGQTSFGSSAFNKSSTSIFGASNSSTFGNTGFGNNNNNNNNNTFGSNGFGNQSTGFGNNNNNNNNNNAFGSNSFGQNNNKLTSFSTGFNFNNNNNNNNSTTNNLFGQNNNSLNNNQTSFFGNNSNNKNFNSSFGQASSTSTFGNTANGSNSNSFGFKTSSGFGSNNSALTNNTSGVTSTFGTSSSLFNKSGFSSATSTTSTVATTPTTFGFGNANSIKPTTTSLTTLTNTNNAVKPSTGFGFSSTATSVSKPNTTLTTVTNSVPTISIKQEIEKTKISRQEPQITPVIEKNKPEIKKPKQKIIIKKINSKMKIREYNNDIQETDSVLSESEQSKDSSTMNKRKSNKISKDIQKLLNEYEKEQKEIKFKEDTELNEIKNKTEKLKIEEQDQKLNIERIQIHKIVEEPEELSNEEEKQIILNEKSDNINEKIDITVSNLIKQEIDKEDLVDKDTIKQKNNIKRLTINNQYEVKPPISQLIQMTDEELSSVKDLEVYVKNIGSIKYLEPVDLLSVCTGKKRENIPYIFGNIIIFQPKSCTVYPDDRIKPEVGQGLNHPAIIELYGCWAKDKSTGKPILDSSLPAYKKHLSTLKKIKDTEFINYEALQGKWCFKVEHFTKYGLFTDDDEDDEDEFDELIINSKKELKIKKKINGKINGGYGLISTDEESSENEANNLNAILNKQSNKTAVVSEVLSEDDIKQKNKLDSMKYCFNSMENAKKLQVMNVSIFGSYNNGNKHSTLKTINYSENLIPISKSRMSKRLEKLNNLKSINNDSVKTPLKVNMKILKQFKKNFEENKKLVITSINNGAPVLSLKSNTKNNMNKLEKEISTLSNISTEDLDKLDIVQSNLESISLCKNSEFNESQNLLMSRSFRVGWGQNNLIAIPSISSYNSSSQEKIQLGIVNIHKILFEDQKEKHIPLLSALLQSSKIKHDFNNAFNRKEILNDIKMADHVITNPVIVRDNSNKSFTNLLNIIKPSINTTFYKTEILMYKLCQILFDNNDISELEECEDILSENQKQYIKSMQIKQNIGKWLKDSLVDSIKITLDKIKAHLEEIKSTDITNDNQLEIKTLINKLIFINLSGGMTINACKEAINNEELRLATLISQLSSCNENISEKKTITRGVPGSGKTDIEYMDMIKHQIEIWEREDTDCKINNIYKDIFKILSGQIDYTVCKDLVDWKQALGLIFWYKDGGSLSFSEALNYFDLLIEEVKVNVPQNSLNANLFNYNEDIIYYLFKYYAHKDFPRSKILLPKNNSNSNLDYRISWVLNQLLPQTDNLSYSNKEKLNDKLTYSYIFQLESIGLWDWACFVAMHLQNSIEREKTIRRILVQYFPLDSNDDSISTVFSSYISNWNLEINSNIISSNKENSKISFLLNPNKNYTNLWHFLVDKLQIPKIWIHDAKRIKAIYKDDILREVFYTMDCEEWNKAHELIVEKLASDLIIHHKYELLYELLKILSQKLEFEENIDNWNLNGGLYLDFINFNESFSRLIERRRSILNNLQQYQNIKNKIDGLKQSINSSEQINSVFSINSMDSNTNQQISIFNNSFNDIQSIIIEINKYLEKISNLLNIITKKKKELFNNKTMNNEIKLQGLEEMEEILMAAYYACNDAKIEYKKYLNILERNINNKKEKREKGKNKEIGFELNDEIQDEEEFEEFEEEKEENEEESNIDALVPNIFDPVKNYQLLSDTSLNENKRLLMIDQLTDKWFNTILDF